MLHFEGAKTLKLFLQYNQDELLSARGEEL